MAKDKALPQIPHDRDSEEALIGCLLVSPDLYTTVAAMVSPPDFYIQRLGWVMESFAAIRSRGGDADIVSVGAELGQRGQLEEAGGPAFLTTLINRVPTTLHVGTYARTVLEYSARRRLLGLANRVAEQIYSGVAAAEIITGTSGALDELVSRIGAVENAPRSFAEIADEHYDAVTYANNHPGERGIETPWAGLNEILHYGWKPRFYIIAGRPAGKSSCSKRRLLRGFRLKRVAYFARSRAAPRRSTGSSRDTPASTRTAWRTGSWPATTGPAIPRRSMNCPSSPFLFSTPPASRRCKCGRSAARSSSSTDRSTWWWRTTCSSRRWT
jgi:hypothetical protein